MLWNTLLFRGLVIIQVEDYIFMTFSLNSFGIKDIIRRFWWVANLTCIIVMDIHLKGNTLSWSSLWWIKKLSKETLGVRLEYTLNGVASLGLFRIVLSSMRTKLLTEWGLLHSSVLIYPNIHLFTYIFNKWFFFFFFKFRTKV